MARRMALVLGATGGIGGEMARQLTAAGWMVRALTRDSARLGAADGWEGLKGDALRRGDVVGAAEGASLIVHAVNPPGYRNWPQTVLPMLDNTLAAARASGARIVLPGTVYNYGPDAFPLIDEDSPQNPTSRKGAIRVEMERRLRAAAEQGVRSLIVRSGDFFGPRAANNWFSQGLVKPGKPVTVVTNPGAPGVGHQWAYLPDVAATMMALIERESDLAPFARFHMGGHWDGDGRTMVGAIGRAVGRPDLNVKRFPWWLLSVASPVVPLFRELREMRYLWQTPVRLDNRRLVRFLGKEPHTPLDEAVRATLIGLGCIAVDSAARSPEAHETARAT
ncbi:Nucleoside-diphosphate-sugar epimerase [Enhydrobacter aerosaccus]|uniref:Nucleoside-diphosphate-sugar epimerase n=1 Tax=Enhydrobacter aerosaccus TaxID=225324 RepID=A0A1T4T899_9HYPH|nr:SDR family oxidoreductase [Enhydrobacter aerosaccus]SKA36656.1 Nucleoside-diphosphate-sugar epimerase [Enhydrobacter aerosaccus]